jgi:hypothetical protein
MNKQTDTFIQNAGKSNQKEVKIMHASGKRYHPGDELKVTWSDVFYIIAFALFMGFVTYLNVGG